MSQERDPTTILAERARRLAIEPSDHENEGQRIEFVEFALAGEHYAVASAHLREVTPMVDLTPLPGTPPFVSGLVNIRGEILSVLDVKHFFGLPNVDLTDLQRILVLHDSEMVFGILADKVIGVRNVADIEIQPPPATLTGLRGQYLRGVAQDGLIILDAQRLLQDPAIVVREQRQQQPGKSPR